MADRDLRRLIREAGSKKENLKKAGKCKGKNCGRRKKTNARKTERTSKTNSKKCRRNDKKCKRNHKNKVRKSRGKRITNAKGKVRKGKKAKPGRKRNNRKNRKKKVRKQCGRQADDATCMANIALAMDYEGNQVANFARQKKRIEGFERLMGNKGGKKGDFANSTNFITSACQSSST